MTYIKPAPGYGIDWSHPLASGLVMCYAMQEGGGLFRDLALPSRTLTLSGVGWGAAGRGGAGMLGALVSDVATLSASLATGTIYTMEMLFTVTTLQAYTMRIISATTGTGNGLQVTGGGLVAYLAGGTTVTSTSGGPDHTTIHGVAVVNGSALTIYFNGKQEATGTNGASMTVDALMNRTTGGRGAVGCLHAARIWNRALSGSEVRTLANTPYCMFQQPRRQRRIASGFFPPNSLSNIRPNNLGGY